MFAQMASASPRLDTLAMPDKFKHSWGHFLQNHSVKWTCQECMYIL